ncbi:protein kinase domain-containing protein [Ditylenchus destructor]|uniref:Protein kinase domain-containing protein n=1 Tax=Ditylenchus destructor TaxID=166010 RepID=A0AAD4MHC8_9BILA|nr:protein kinase domain-containing protein [Ditylenchus destructor]
MSGLQVESTIHVDIYFAVTSTSPRTFLWVKTRFRKKLSGETLNKFVLMNHLINQHRHENNIIVGQVVSCRKTDGVPGISTPDHVSIDYARGYDDTIQPNAKLADFEIIRELGHGNFGNVSLVKYKLTQEVYAMKEIKRMANKHNVATCDWEKYVKELRIMRGMESPYIVKLHFYFFDNDAKTCAMYLVMQAFEAGDLLKMINKTGGLMNRDSALRFIAANMVLAIDYLHKRKVAHRDIKPANFLVGEDGYLALGDFGLSVLLRESCTSEQRCGTIGYMAPEIMSNRLYNQTVDWWSLGVTLYRIAKNTELFRGITIEELRDNVVNQPIAMPDAMAPDMKSFLLALLNRDPTQRLGAKGSEEVKKHPFFEGMDWAELEKKLISAPLLPRFKPNGKLENYYTIDQLMHDPTFTFSFYPPVSWTYHNNQPLPGRTDVIPVYPKQWSNQADAEQKMKGDMKSAVIDSLQKSGLSSSGLKVTLSDYTPEDVPILDVDTTNQPGSYKAEYGRLVYRRTGSGGTTRTLCIKNMAVQVSIQFRASRTQWENFASYLYDHLKRNYKIRFKPLTEIALVIDSRQ